MPKAGSRSISIGGYVAVTNVGTSYDAVNLSKGLGMALIDFSHINTIYWQVFVNKIGTGTQSWQLYNVTDAAELGVIDDAGTTGDKTLSLTITTGIPSGEKLMRIRAKSTVGSDDPVYYGGTIRCC